MIGPEHPTPLPDLTGVVLGGLAVLLVAGPPACNALSEEAFTYSLEGSVLGYPGARYVGEARELDAEEVAVGLWEVEASPQRPPSFPTAPVVVCRSAECRAFFPGRRVELRCYVEYTWAPKPRREICVFERYLPELEEGGHAQRG